jgi:uncharacterized phiE125 gp8 family phage protein
MLAPVRTVPPATTPVSLSEAKAHLRVDHADEDAFITSLVAAATEHLDGWSGVLGRALITQTWRQDFAEWEDALRLPLLPVQSATVTYVDRDGATQTLASSEWVLLADGAGAFISPVGEWPEGSTIKVTFVAGYGNAAAVPAPLKAAILMMVSGLYENREDKVRGMAENRVVAALIAPYRRVSL